MPESGLENSFAIAAWLFNQLASSSGDVSETGPLIKNRADAGTG
jgi:hypothetical protein